MKNNNSKQTKNVQDWWRAVDTGNVIQIEKLLSKNSVDVNITRPKDPPTALLSAAIKNNLKMAELLLKFEAKPNLANSQGTVPLHIAVAKNNKELVHLLLGSKADPNLANQYGAMPLHVAVHEGDAQLVHLLLESGADPNLFDTHGCSPLPIAIEKQNSGVVGLLLKFGADPNLVTNRGLAPLHIAVQKPAFRIIRMLCEGVAGDGGDANSVKKADINKKFENFLGGEVDSHQAKRADSNKIVTTDGGLTALHMAVDKQIEIVVAYLLLQNASLEETCFIDCINGMTALHIAAKRDNPAIVSRLLKQRASLEAVASSSDVKNITPLHFAASHAGPEVVRSLLEHGANVNAETSKGRTPWQLAARREDGPIKDSILKLFQDACQEDVNGQQRVVMELFACAVENNQTKTILQLLDRGFDVNTRGEAGSSALHLAVRHGQVEVIGILCLKGADVNAKHDSGYTPLHIAAKIGYVPGIQELLKQPGINKELKTDEGFTALHLAVLKNDSASTEALLEEKAEVDAKVGGALGGSTPLHLAAEKGYSEVVEILLNRGASMDQLRDGRMAFHIAAENGHKEVIGKFLDKEFDINKAELSGETALHLAIKKVQKEMVSFLLARGAGIDLEDRNKQTPLSLAQKQPNIFDNVILHPVQVKLNTVKSILEIFGKPTIEKLNERGAVSLSFHTDPDASRFFQALCICYTSSTELSHTEHSVVFNVLSLNSSVANAEEAKIRIKKIEKKCNNMFSILKDFDIETSYEVDSIGVRYLAHNKEAYSKLSQLEVWQQYSLQISMQDSSISIHVPFSTLLEEEGKLSVDLKEELKSKMVSTISAKNGKMQPTESEMRQQQLAAKEQQRKEEEVKSRKKTIAERLAYKQQKAEAKEADLARQKEEAEIFARGRAEYLARQKTERGLALALKKEQAIMPLNSVKKPSVVVEEMEKEEKIGQARVELRPLVPLDQKYLADEVFFGQGGKQGKNSKKKQKRHQQQLMKGIERIKSLRRDGTEDLDQARRAIEELMKKQEETILEYGLCLLSDLKPSEKMQEKVIYLCEKTRQCKFLDGNAKANTFLLNEELDLSDLSSKQDDAKLKWQLSEYLLAARYPMGFWDVAMQRYILQGVLYILDMIRTVNSPLLFEWSLQQLVLIRNRLAHECYGFDKQGEPKDAVLYPKDHLIAMGNAIMDFKAFAEDTDLLDEVEQLVSIFEDNQGIVIEKESGKMHENHLRRIRINLWRLQENMSSVDNQPLPGNEPSNSPLTSQLLDSAIVMLYCKIGEAHRRVRSSNWLFKHCKHIRNKEYHQVSSQSSQGIEKYVANPFNEVFEGAQALLMKTNFHSLTRFQQLEIPSSSFFATSSSTEIDPKDTSPRGIILG